MNPKKFSEAMSEIDSKYVDEAIRYKRTGKKRSWIRWAASAACFALVAVVAASVMNQAGDRIALSDNSSKVTARYTDKPVSMQSSCLLLDLTEEELFTKDDTAIFKGKIAELNYIELNFKGDKEYCAIAEIEVEKVYRGPCNAGDTVSVLLPCPIVEEEGYWVEDTDIVASMRVGMTGIFMPMPYNDTSIWGQNGATLALKDIADYGFGDGMRYAFLETSEGLLFSRDAYESISDAATLDEIESYVLDMINR